MRWALALALLAAGCGRKTPAPPAPDPMVRSVALPQIDYPDLPDAPGRAVFMGACLTCHTSRYVAEQPPFPRRVWEAEVNKMRKVYGAPFPEEATASIVDYLVAIRGARE